MNAFTPAAEVWRDGDKWMVSLAVPGIDPDKLQIDVAGRVLRIRGERTRHQKVDPILNEISYGRFEREFTLPEEIDSRQVGATYRQGLLELTLPLSEGAKPHRIPVKSESDERELATA